MNNRLLILWFAGRGYILAALLGLLVRFRLNSHSPLRWEWLALIALGMFLRLWAGAHLGLHGNAMQAQSPKLCTTGPYRFSRNPLYVANILTGFGLIGFANCLPLWLEGSMLMVLGIHHSILVRWEEQKLCEHWGDAYEDYARTTPRWWGRSRAAVGEKNSAQWNKVWIWQGRNLAYTILAVLLLWGASRWQ